MSRKIKVKIGIIGFLPFSFNRKFIKKWKSDVFEIVGNIEQYHINSKSDTSSWGYSDSCLEQVLPKDNNADFVIGVTYIQLEDNYYARRLSSNRIVLSYFEMYQIFQQGHISVESFLLRTIYRYVLVFLGQEKIPIQKEALKYLHDDSRGCIFDMNGYKSDVIFSLDRPKICDDCVIEIRRDKVSDNYITQIKKELRKIKKGRFYRIDECIRRRPILSFIISAVIVISLNLISNMVWKFITTNFK